MTCTKFHVLPTSQTLYGEKYKTVRQFQVIEQKLNELEEKENKKQQQNGKRG